MRRHCNKLVCLFFAISMIVSLVSCDVIYKVLDKSHQHNCEDGNCECGEPDSDYVDLHTHNFVDGKCECGKSASDHVEPQPYKNALLIGDNKFVVTDRLKTIGYELFAITVTERSTYNFACEGGIFVRIFTDDIDSADFYFDGSFVGASWSNYAVNIATLNPGEYYVGVYYHLIEVGEYNVNLSVEKVDSPYMVVINEGKNTLIFSTAEIDADKATRKLVITTAGTYMFEGGAFVSKVLADGTEVAKNADYSYTLAAGEYTVCFSMFSTYQTKANTPIPLKVNDINLVGG